MNEQDTLKGEHRQLQEIYARRKLREKEYEDSRRHACVYEYRIGRHCPVTTKPKKSVSDRKC